MKGLGELERYNLLMLSDAARPALAQLVAGEPIKGSWWGHPAGHAIFDAANALEAHPDVLIAKLVDGKVTFVHRALWPALLGVASERAPWQLEGLSAGARTLLEALDSRSGARPAHRPEEAVHPGVAKELDQRLLAHVWEVHTDRGAHEKRVESWESWAAREGVVAVEGREILERAVAAFGGGKLPWKRRR